MIGISVYAGMENSLEENIEYMNKARKFGITELFTSLHIPESNEQFEKEAIEILKEANRLNMKVTADISKKYYDELEINKFHINSLRIDFGFTNKEIAELTRKENYSITFNASTLDERDIEEILKYGGDISKIKACHNYYPKKDTGISEKLFVERNAAFKKYEIEVTAFVSSKYKKRGPIYEGLPTLEKHRDIDPLIATQHLLRLGADKVLIGDLQASDKELERLSNIKKNIVLIPIRIYHEISSEERYILNKVHTNRKDPGEFLIRSQEARNYKKGEILPNNTIERNKYCVTIDNKEYLRYEGDLQILKKEFMKDPRVNVVADAKEAAILIEDIEPGERFEFEIVED